MPTQRQHIDLAGYEELRRSLDPRAKLFLPTSDGYSEAKIIWNGMFDNHNPALIVQVMGVADVQAVLQFAHQRGLAVTARAGGHSFAGLSTIQDGIVIDFIQMKTVTVNPEKKEVIVEPGVLLGELDQKTQEFGLATPVGVVSVTGVFGLVLGGGVGWLSRKFGASVDNILSAEVVLADGEHVTASANENSDLFWALRGCAPNFGIVTSLVLRAHPVGLCYRGDYCYPISQIKEVLFGVNNYLKTGPKEFGCELFNEGPMGDDRKTLLRLAYTFYLPEGEAEKAAAPLTKLGSPIEASWRWITHVQNQKLFDDKVVGHRKYYAKSRSIKCDDMTIEFVDSMVESVNNSPSPYSMVELVAIGGKMKETTADATSYFHLREQDWLVNVITTWSEGNGDEEILWCKETYKKLNTKSQVAYINAEMIHPPTDTSYQEQLNNVFGPNLDGLRKIKKKYDPLNFFHHNFNLLPADDN